MACLLAVTALAGCSADGGGSSSTGRSAGGADGARQGDGQGRADGLAGASAARIAKEAVAAMRSVPSLRMTGEVRTGGDRLRLDMALTRNGDCTGTVTSASDGEAQVRKKGGSDYVKADASFWKSVVHGGRTAETAAALLEGRWMRVPESAASSARAGAAGAGFTSLCDLRTTLAELGGHGRPGHTAPVTKGRATRVKGTPAVPLRGRLHSARGDGRAAGAYTAYVATEGRPYVVKLDKKGGSGPSSVVFGGFGKPVHVVAPPKRSTVGLGDLFASVLGGGGTGR